MKKTITLLSAFALVVAAHAQLINPGFETWTPDVLVPSAMNPNTGNASTGWWTYNMFNYSVLGSSPISVLRCDTAHSGNYSARIESVIYTPTSHSYNAPWGLPFIGHNYLDTLGILFNGTTNETSATYKPGIPFTQKIATLSFWYLYAPQSGDTAECRALLVTNRVAQGGGVFWTTTATGSTWQQATITFTYVDVQTPDTLYILFSSSSLDSKPQPGSVFWVDDVSVTLLSGVNQLLGENGSVDVFPNPACDAVNFHITGVSNVASLSIVDITGQKISSAAVHNDFTTINTQAYCNGLYFYQFYDSAGNLITSDKFSVVK